MNYYEDREQIRRRMKRRYNRRFLLAAHLTIFLGSLLMAWFAPVLRLWVLGVMFLLIPHLLWVAYAEYQDWLERKLDRELRDQDWMSYEEEKPKRYPEEEVEASRFRLTDDGEIEPAHLPKDKRSTFRAHEPRPRERDYQSRRYREEISHRKAEKKRRKYDTDEFDLKTILKKLKDIID